MTRTTADWEALLSEAEPGPWEMDIGEDEHGRDAPYLDVDMEYVGNILLAAAAPDAVAEVVRLRRGLEEAISVCEEGDTHRHASFAKILTRILEGEA